MSKPTVTYFTVTTPSGKVINRYSTRVTLADGRVVEFYEKLSKREAIIQATSFQGR